MLEEHNTGFVISSAKGKQIFEAHWSSPGKIEIVWYKNKYSHEQIRQIIKALKHLCNKIVIAG